MGGKRWTDLCRGVQQVLCGGVSVASALLQVCAPNEVPYPHPLAAQAIDALTDGDVVTVVSFSDGVQAYGPDVKARFDLRPFLARPPDGGTALYDATIAALVVALRLHSAVDATTAMSTLTYVVVMTDGEDTSSRTSITDVQAVLQRINRLRNFKVVFAGVDLPPGGVSAIARLVAVGDSDISFLNLRDGFGGVFEHVCIALQARAVAR